MREKIVVPVSRLEDHNAYAAHYKINLIEDEKIMPSSVGLI